MACKGGSAQGLGIKKVDISRVRGYIRDGASLSKFFLFSLSPRDVHLYVIPPVIPWWQTHDQSSRRRW